MYRSSIELSDVTFSLFTSTKTCALGVSENLICYLKRLAKRLTGCILLSRAVLVVYKANIIYFIMDIYTW